MDSLEKTLNYNENLLVNVTEFSRRYRRTFTGTNDYHDESN